jgi:uncharacterized protein YutE (UPF0331/DUF86 family)
VSDFPHWATGPSEILQHGIELLGDDSDKNRRLAMISIDNSVELMMQTYIQLPRRVTGLDISRSKRDEYCKNFPSLLDGIEENAAVKIVGFDLGHIEWFHRLRNQLYHDGNGLTVERTKVEVYAELAQRLFESLFEVQLAVSNTANMRKYGEFIDSWVKIEKALIANSPANQRFVTLKAIAELRDEGKITKDEAEKLNLVRNTRNRLVHGEAEPEEVLNGRLMQIVKQTLETAARLLVT